MILQIMRIIYNIITYHLLAIRECIKCNHDQLRIESNGSQNLLLYSNFKVVKKVYVYENLNV